MSEASVLYEVADGVATVTLNEPARMNPLSDALQRGVLDAIERVCDDVTVRALLLTAHGKGFCVGADLADLSVRSRDMAPGDTLGGFVGRMMDATGNPIVTGLRSLPVPVVCAMNGAAAGGGVGLALACDLVVAARSAYFYLPFVPALGIVPDLGSTWVLPRAVGRARAMGLALTGDRLPAEKAQDWGLIWACVDDDQLQAEARKLARKLADLPAHAIAEIRAMFAAAETNTFEQQVMLERERQAQLIDRESFLEGLQAFGERRKPNFLGRGGR
jgi:2-(1,2-epoxy-1,2-dihydrophenyl)acetyl-CoA isomerase